MKCSSSKFNKNYVNICKHNIDIITCFDCWEEILYNLYCQKIINQYDQLQREMIEMEEDNH